MCCLESFEAEVANSTQQKTLSSTRFSQQYQNLQTLFPQQNNESIDLKTPNTELPQPAMLNVKMRILFLLTAITQTPKCLHT